MGKLEQQKAPEGMVKDASYWAHVRAAVDKAPPLTAEQRLRLRALAHHGQT